MYTLLSDVVMKNDAHFAVSSKGAELDAWMDGWMGGRMLSLAGNIWFFIKIL
jgi:hypothetical protein